MATQINTLIRGDVLSTMPFKIYSLQEGIKRYHQQPVLYRNPCYEFIWIRNGSGKYSIDALEYAVQNCTLFFTIPGQACRFTVSPETEGFVIQFTQPFLSECEDAFIHSHHIRLFDIFFNYSALSVNQETADEIEDIAKRMMKEFSNYFLLRSEILKRYMNLLLVHIIRLIETTTPATLTNRRMLIVNKFFSLLERHYTKKKMVAQYAEELSVTPKYLNEAIKKTFGYPASYFIKQRIVLEAKRKAIYSGANMKEIAYELGFEDMGHFSKYFKNTLGINFTKFRKEASHHAA